MEKQIVAEICSNLTWKERIIVKLFRKIFVKVYNKVRINTFNKIIDC